MGSAQDHTALDSKFPHFGRTALHLAVENKHMGFAGLLLEAGADPADLSSPLLSSTRAVSALDLAEQAQHPDMLSLLQGHEVKQAVLSVDPPVVKKSESAEDRPELEARLIVLNEHWDLLQRMEIESQEESKNLQTDADPAERLPTQTASEYVPTDCTTSHEYVSATPLPGLPYQSSSEDSPGIPSPQPSPQASPTSSPSLSAEGSPVGSVSSSPQSSPQGSRRASLSNGTSYYTSVGIDTVEPVFDNLSNQEFPEEFDIGEQVSFECLELGKELGKGHYGSVQRARMSEGPARQTSARDIAVKIFNVDQAARELGSRVEAYYSFAYEIQLLRKCQHPCVVEFYGVSNPPDEPQNKYMLMELCSGGTLKGALHDARQPMAWSARYLALLDVACALRALHRLGILHRDLKTENVLLGADGRGKVADLGCAVSDSSVIARNSAVVDQNFKVKYNTLF